jgi:MarR family transcriptional regulator, temperature-dependent positive regulator of motility
MMTSDLHYKLMRLLEANPSMSQREAAQKLNVSLGKVNYCLQALIKRGWIKASHFKNSRNKAAYLYLLTPRGIRHKAMLTVRFLHAKTQEYEALRAEIRQMRREAKTDAAVAGQAGARRLRDESAQ